MKWSVPRFGRPRRGQSLVELALVLPFCLWVALGIVDFGRVYFFYAASTNAAREGARYWASYPTATADAVRTKVRAEGSPQVTITDGMIALTPSSGACTADCAVQVSYPFTAITPMISSLWGGGTLTVTTKATMPRMAS
jgi:Flp pilus assembly protein TadG